MCADIEWIRHSQKYMDIMRGIQGAESIEEVWIDSACYLKAWEQKFWYVPNFLYGILQKILYYLIHKKHFNGKANSKTKGFIDLVAEIIFLLKKKRDTQRQNYGHFIDNLLPLFISFIAISLMPKDENQGAWSTMCLRLKLIKSNVP